mmetsp:Transcript_20283/g.29004  ORF Transcript_20283/g.29004 Transcript_20283/m.29004 type:complete len:112 (+) Transcript_20283:438-773(+)
MVVVEDAPAGVDAASPSCFFKIRNRAGLFLNNRFTCVAECLERMVVVDDVMAKIFACRPMAGVLFATDLATPQRDIFLLSAVLYQSIQSLALRTIAIAVSVITRTLPFCSQ